MRSYSEVIMDLENRLSLGLDVGFLVGLDHRQLLDFLGLQLVLGVTVVVLHLSQFLSHGVELPLEREYPLTKGITTSLDVLISYL